MTDTENIIRDFAARTLRGLRQAERDARKQSAAARELRAESELRRARSRCSRALYREPRSLAHVPDERLAEMIRKAAPGDVLARLVEEASIRSSLRDVSFPTPLRSIGTTMKVNVSIPKASPKPKAKPKPKPKPKRKPAANAFSNRWYVAVRDEDGTMTIPETDSGEPLERLAFKDAQAIARVLDAEGLDVALLKSIPVDWEPSK